MTKPKTVSYEVVWSGRDSLLPDRPERWDRRFAGMPSLDLDEGEAEEVAPKRKYTKTGRHVGKCSRTNPDAPQYLPNKKRLETENNG